MARNRQGNFRKNGEQFPCKKINVDVILHDARKGFMIPVMSLSRAGLKREERIHK